MKVRVQWTYSYWVSNTFDEIVDVPDAYLEGLTPAEAASEAADLAWQAASQVGNEALTVRETRYPPTDPDETLDDTTIVDDAIPARIRYTGEDDDPVLLPTDDDPAL